MKRRVVVAGNWKMNLGPGEARGFFGAFSPDFGPGPVPELMVFPPAISILAVLDARPASPRVAVGVQNVHWEPAGAFTGEISAPMAREAGVSHALVGHSERRQHFGESDGTVALRTRAVLEAGLTPLVCVGETLQERKDGSLREVILRQLEAVLDLFGDRAEEDLLLAYEPVWAIGTGETATPEDAAEAHGILRDRLASALGRERASALPILYGGSVKPGNALELLRAADVDGVLVGGASLDPGSFAGIARAGAEVLAGA